MITICLPTYKSQVTKNVEEIGNSVSGDVQVIASCQEGSAAYNRNYCLERALGEIIIMVDDDITGFFPGWNEVLIKPLLADDSISIVSARLTNPDGTNAPMMYDGTPFKIVPSSAIAFRKNPLRFDENYLGGGFEDTDFCKQMESAYPDKRTLINEDCRLVHLNEKKNQGFMGQNRKYFVSKWGWVHKPKEFDRTIIYYSGNTEKESFEQKVRDNILRVKGALPLISVSQKPLDFGKNICVGDVGKSYLNAFRQCLIGCETATTPFVVLTESDCLYPDTGYFDFEPTDLETIYSYDEVYMMWNRENRTRFYKHGTTCGSIIVGREFYASLIREGLKDKPMWGIMKAGANLTDPKIKYHYFHGKDPIVNIKTREGVSFGTTLLKGAKPQESLPYWGSVAELKMRLFDDPKL